jgi:hypothetical protein
MGRSRTELTLTDAHIKLVIWRPEGQTCRYISALRSTADYYGWTKEFEIWRPKTLYTQSGYSFSVMPKRQGRGHAVGGKRLRICRSPRKSGNPAGFTNQFKVSNSCRTADLAELANFTQGDWHWMEDLSGKRVSKEHWAEIYESGTTSRRGGLVTA